MSGEPPTPADAARRSGSRRAALAAIAAPGHLHASAVTPDAVTLRWKRPRGVRGKLSYELLRNGHHLGVAHGTEMTDTGVAPATSYSYVIRGLGPHGTHGHSSRPLRVRTPAASASQGAPVPASGAPSSGTPAATQPVVSGTTTTPPGDGGTTTTPGDGGTTTTPPPGGGTAPATLTRAMVDRLWWRAGFGATDVERSQWVGQPVADLVDFFLTEPQALTSTTTPPLTQQNGPIDPLVGTNDLIQEWIDTMQRAQNPLTERLTLFWHRHFAVARSSGVPAAFLINYRNRLRRYGDLAANPQASFRDLANEMSTADGAMSQFLTGYTNTVGSPNENYAREFQELFTLGVLDAQGNPNYSQIDVTQLARAFTGWRLDQNTASPTYGQVSFSAANFDGGQKTIYGQTANFGAITDTPPGAVSAVDLVLAHPSHAPFLCNELWSEFIVTPIPADTLADLVSTYTAGDALQLAPVVRKILSHPLIFESIDEPNMVKPPIVYTAGALRLMGGMMKYYTPLNDLTMMQQIPYDPPNVAGWEGGLSWLNTTTVRARFELIKSLQFLKYGTPQASGGAYPGAQPVADVLGETAQQAYDRAYAAVGSPWLSSAGAAQILSFAQGFAQNPGIGSVTQRAWLQYALRALFLGGPDAQVM